MIEKLFCFTTQLPRRSFRYVFHRSPRNVRRYVTHADLNIWCLVGESSVDSSMMSQPVRSPWRRRKCSRLRGGSPRCTEEDEKRIPRRRCTRDARYRVARGRGEGNHLASYGGRRWRWWWTYHVPGLPGAAAGSRSSNSSSFRHSLRLDYCLWRRSWRLARTLGVGLGTPPDGPVSLHSLHRGFVKPHQDPPWLPLVCLRAWPTDQRRRAWWIVLVPRSDLSTSRDISIWRKNSEFKPNKLRSYWRKSGKSSVEWVQNMHENTHQQVNPAKVLRIRSRMKEK